MNERFNCRDLNWDTNYFGVKCGRIDFIEEINCTDKNIISNFIKNYEFVVITNSRENPNNNVYIGTELNGFIADINVQLKKTKMSIVDDKCNDSIKLLNKCPFQTDIVTLARQEFKKSRFLNDPNISVEQAEGIYGNWVENSFDIENKYFITYSLDNEIVGFLLFSRNTEREIVIELICVSIVQSGKGIGKQLMSKLDEYAITEEIRVIKVGTQIENVNALNFYISCGYTINDVKYIYHLWTK